MDKSKIINIILVSIILLVLIFCIVFLVVKFNNSPKIEDNVILRDMSDAKDREVEEKEEYVKEDDGTFTLKVQLPEGYKDPDEALGGLKGTTQNNNTQDNPESPKPTGPTKVNENSIYVGNPNNSELTDFQPNESTVIISEEYIEEVPKEDFFSKGTISMVFTSAYWNSKGYKQMSGYIYDGNMTEVNVKELCKKNGAIIVPFSILSEEKLENVKEWYLIYKIYNNQIPIIFYNTSVGYNESIKDIKKTFEDYEIDKTVPFYMNEYNDLMTGFDYIDKGYFVLNKDGYVIQSGNSDEDLLNISEIFSTLDVLNHDFKLEEQRVMTLFDEGIIQNFKDVRNYVDGTLEYETDVEQ